MCMYYIESDLEKMWYQIHALLLSQKEVTQRNWLIGQHFEDNDNCCC